MARQLMKEDLIKAKAIHLYNEDTVYVELNDTEDVYGCYKGGEWFVKRNYWDYWESSLMLSYFKPLTPDEALRLIENWRAEKYDVSENNSRLDKAIIFATEKHSGQLRKGTSLPYILHPLEVLQILCSMRADTNILIAGVLHDTVEDTDTSAEEIAELFGDDVAQLVLSNSEDKDKSWDERKQHTIDALKCADIRVRKLILADKLANLRSIAFDYRQMGDELWKRFNAPKEKQAWYYDGIADSLYGMQFIPECEKAYWEFTGLFKDVFVRFYLDEKDGSIYQSCCTGTVYRFNPHTLEWEDFSAKLASDISAGITSEKQFYSVCIPDSATEITREYAEFLEDSKTRKIK